MLAKILITSGLVSAGLLLFILTTTTPESAGAVGILGIFLFSYIFILSTFTFILWFLSALSVKFAKRKPSSRSGTMLTLKKSYYYSSIISLGPVIIIGLQSVGGAGIYEIGLVSLFILLGCIYVARRSSQ